jgi:acetylornithine/N-succinyldiaminopimelate aminotransferase
MSSAEAIIADDQQYILQVYGRPGFVFERGEGCHLYDTEGRRYLDMVAGIAVNALGYSDPDVAEAIRSGASGLLHLSNLYHNTHAAPLARLLVESCPGVDRAFLCNSGTEAIEGAIKFSRRYALDMHGQGKHTIVACTGSFHGRTIGAVSITGREKYRQPFEPVMPGVRFIDFNDAAAAADAIREDVCAVFIEPVQGEGGLSVATQEFLDTLRARCDAVDALLVFDEIQCGMARTGTLWAHEANGVSPDIMTVAKPLGGGLPIGAILMREKVARTIHPGDHGSTFAGGPFVTSVARTVFQKISDPAFIARVREVSDYLDESLHELLTSSPKVLELRGRGLMRGIRVDGSAGAVREAGHAQGLLVATAGDDVVRLVPPLVLERRHVDEAVEKIGVSLKAI